MTSYHTIQQVEDSSALAVTARQRLTSLADMLASIHRQGRPLSDYNLRVATDDISEAIHILRRLQDDLCMFRGKT